MPEIITAILAGGFSGAGIVIYLSKKLVESQLNKTLKKYQHELDIKKETLATDLSLHASLQNLKLTRYEESKRDAIHNIYNAVIETSSSRVGFKKVQQLENCKDNSEYTARYFESLSASFKAFTSAYNAISDAYRVLEKESIYIEPDLEQEVLSCLQVIHDTYNSNYDYLSDAHDAADKLNSQHNFNMQTRPIDLNDFYDKSTAEWSYRTMSAREKLKETMRELLSI
ncbi:hypothetical protein [Vibrio mediterranei]|uniref:hypothetical protein n=1 Tax=Vibrio mediterranei TaxID=689 RepID=UPI001EFD7B1C|nr:hypothetical protein [Vibrio mediterranei]MCG9656762.1 hypothetical protein [Vibrio mediterranei]